MAEALLKKAQGHLDAEEDEQALQAANEAASTFREAKNLTGLADALMVNVCALIAQGKRKEANKLAQDELASFVVAEHKLGEARMHLAIGEANCQHRGRENKAKALEAASKALRLFAAEGDQRMEGNAHILIANIQIATGCAEESIRAANMALASLKAASDKRGEGIAQHCLAVALTKSAEANGEDCTRAAKAAILCFQEVGLKKMEAFEHVCHAKWTNELEGKPAKALKLALKAQAFCRDCGCQEHEALGVTVECYLNLAKKDSSSVGCTVMSAKAVRAAQEGIDRFKAIGNKLGEACAWESMTMAQISQGAEDDAAQTAQSAAEAFREAGDKEQELRMLQFTANLHHKTGRSAEAAIAAEEMLKKAQNTNSKVAALETVFSAYMQKKEYTKAKDAAKKLCNLLQQAKNRQKEGLAKLLMCQAYSKSEDFSQSASIAREAQALLHDAKDIAGEAKALRTIAKIHFFAQEFEFAERAAYKARELVRDAGDPQAEGDAALLLGTIRMQMLQSLDDRTSNEGFTSHFFELLDAAKEAKWIGKTYGNAKLVGCSLMLMAQAYTMVNELADALRFTEEAAKLFREAEDDRNLARLLLIEAEAWFAGGEQPKAQQSCKQALRIFQDLKDAAGEDKAFDVMERINPPTPPPEIVWEVEDAKIPESKMKAAPRAEPEPDENEQKLGAAFKKKTLGKLNMNKVDPDLLRLTLYNVVQEVVGFEMDFLEDDLPLMQAGIASRQAVTLRAALEDELKGIAFPATVVFDFPTISSIQEYIMDTI